MRSRATRVSATGNNGGTKPAWWSAHRTLSDAAYSAYLAQAGVSPKDKAAAAVVSLSSLIAEGWANQSVTTHPPGRVVSDSGVVRYGAHNKLLQSDDLTSGQWLLVNATRSANPAVDVPGFGVLPTTKIVAAPGSAQHYIRNSSGAVYAGELCEASVIVSAAEWSRVALYWGGGPAGGTWFNLATQSVEFQASGFAGTIEPLDSGFFMCKVKFTSTGASGTMEIHPVPPTATAGSFASTGDGVSGVNVHRAAIGACEAPESIKTLESAVYGPRMTFSSGQQLGLLSEGVQTEQCIHNSDLTQTVWVKSNMSPALIVGQRGTASTASRITATANNATATQAITLASASLSRGLWARRQTGSGAVSISYDGGATYTDITAQVLPYWSRIDLGTETRANPSIVIRLATSGDVIDVESIACRIGGGPILSPMYSGASALTRSADVITDPLGWPPEGTLLIEADGVLNNSGTVGIVGQNTANASGISRSAANAIYHDNWGGGLAQQGVAAQTTRIALTWGTGYRAISTNGGAAVAVSQGIGTANVRRLGATGNGANAGAMIIKRLSLRSSKASASDLAQASAGQK